MSVLTDLKNRGVRDVFFLVCDGLKGLPEVVGNVWPLAIVQTCIIHLIRNTFRLTSARMQTRSSGISGRFTPHPAWMRRPRRWMNWRRNGVINMAG